MITQPEDYFAQGCGRCSRFATPACSSQTWAAGLQALRQVCLGVGLVETAKWGHPCYTHQGRNIAILGALRGDFRLTFFNASLLQDPQQLLQRKADWLQLPSDAQALLQPWLQTIVSTPLPLQAADAPMQPLGSPLVLQTLAANTLWAEMEFSLPVGQLGSKELDAHIQRHVLPGLERPSLQNNVLQGMLSGFMDLVLQHDGRYWVLDYKSNLLADYQAHHLNSAILAKRYEVQYVLYTLALHRLLQSRLPNYRYEQHMGGAVYLFLRGIDTPSAGVHCMRPPWALIDLLDQRFAKVLL